MAQKERSLVHLPDNPKQAFVDFMQSRPTYTRERPDPESVDRLREIARAWSDRGQHFYSGYILCQASDFAWGDPDLMAQCRLA